MNYFSNIRHTVIGLLGHVQSPQAQKLLVKDVVRRQPIEKELKLAIFFLGIQEKPTKVSRNIRIFQGFHYFVVCYNLGSKVLIDSLIDQDDTIIESVKRNLSTPLCPFFLVYPPRPAASLCLISMLPYFIKLCTLLLRARSLTRSYWVCIYTNNFTARGCTFYMSAWWIDAVRTNYQM